MKDQILFKGKSKKTGEWITSNSIIQVQGKIYFALFCGASIASIENALVEVLPETVGRYIEGKDSSGKEIFEGDIVKHPDWKTDFTIDSELSSNCGCCGYVIGWDIPDNDLSLITIVGNIHNS